MTATTPATRGDPVEELGRVDIYLLDQVMRGRVAPGARIFEAGCGGGRNLELFLRLGHPVSALDPDPAAIGEVRRLAESLGRGSGVDLRAEPIEASSFPAAAFDLVVSCAVLHFARDAAQFAAMLEATWRHLAAGGVFFCRLASSIGLEDRVRPLGGGRHLLPDGSERFLVDEAALLGWTERLGGRLLDPLKTTLVQGQRAMSTWVLGAPP